MMKQAPRVLLALIGMTAATALAEAPVVTADEPPPGVEQLLPRGRIAAVMNPQFVSAAEAELPEDAWIFGVVVDGLAKAYSLNLLNRHEVVNDRTGETAYAAVW